jgi:subtilisin family serine protease
MSNPAHGHGTLVAGILAAVAPDSMIMPLRAFDDGGNADDFTIAKAIQYAIENGAHVINMSFGTLNSTKTLKDMIKKASKHGVILVASAGNNSTEAKQYPAAYHDVISTAAVSIDDIKARFSNYGREVAVTAPGASIISSYPGGHWAVVSGTSFAAPMVAGEAALLLSSRVFATQKESLEVTVETVKEGVVLIDGKNPNYEEKLGTGRIDLLKVLTKSLAELKEERKAAKEELKAQKEAAKEAEKEQKKANKEAEKAQKEAAAKQPGT